METAKQKNELLDELTGMVTSPEEMEIVQSWTKEKEDEIDESFRKIGSIATNPPEHYQLSDNVVESSANIEAARAAGHEVNPNTTAGRQAQ